MNTPKLTHKPMRAFKDLLYMIGLWFIGRVSQDAMADLMADWARGVRNKPHDPSNCKDCFLPNGKKPDLDLLK